MSTIRLETEERIEDFSPIVATLRDGRRVTLRAIRPDDAEALRKAFDHLSGEGRITRFMAAMKELPGDMLAHAVHPVPGQEVALVAVAQEDGEDTIVAGARYITDARHEVAEFAVTVTDEWQGLGLATALLRELIRIARARGLRFIEGFVLARNRAMLECAKRLGFEVITGTDDPGTVLVRLNLRPG